MGGKGCGGAGSSEGYMSICVCAGDGVIAFVSEESLVSDQGAEERWD